MKAKLTYIRLNSQTPRPPRGAVPVNQQMLWDAFSLATSRFAFGHGRELLIYFP